MTINVTVQVKRSDDLIATVNVIGESADEVARAAARAAEVLGGTEDVIAAAVLAEREACAQLVKDHAGYDGLANVIRRRGDDHTKLSSREGA